MAKKGRKKRVETLENELKDLEDRLALCNKKMEEISSEKEKIEQQIKEKDMEILFRLMEEHHVGMKRVKSMIKGGSLSINTEKTTPTDSEKEEKEDFPDDKEDAMDEG